MPWMGLTQAWFGIDRLDPHRLHQPRHAVVALAAQPGGHPPHAIIRCVSILLTLIGSRALAAYDDVDGSSIANNRPWSRQCTARLFEGLTPVHVPILSE